MERWAPPPESCQPHVPPYPPPGPSFTVLWRGLGGQRRLSTPLIRKVCGLAVSCPFSKKSHGSDNDGKGAETSWVLRPIYSLMTYAFISACKQEQAAKPRRRSRPKRTNRKGRTKGQRPRGVFGMWVPSWHTHIQHFTSQTLLEFGTRPSQNSQRTLRAKGPYQF